MFLQILCLILDRETMEVKGLKHSASENKSHFKERRARTNWYIPVCSSHLLGVEIWLPGNAIFVVLVYILKQRFCRCLVGMHGLIL